MVRHPSRKNKKAVYVECSAEAKSTPIVRSAPTGNSPSSSSRSLPTMPYSPASYLLHKSLALQQSPYRSKRPTSVFVFSPCYGLGADADVQAGLTGDEEDFADEASTAFVGIDSVIGVTWHKRCYCTVVLTTQNAKTGRILPRSATKRSPDDTGVQATEKAHIRSIINEALPSEVFFVEIDPRVNWYISIKIKKYGLGKMVKREIESVLVPFLTNGEVQLRQGILNLRSGWVRVKRDLRQGFNLGLQGYRYAIKQYNKKTKKWSNGYLVLQFRDAQNSRICLATSKNDLHTSINLSKLQYVAACDERYLGPLQGFPCRIFYWDNSLEQPASTRLRVNFSSQRARLSFIERVLMHLDSAKHTIDRSKLNLFVGTWNAGNEKPHARSIEAWIPPGKDMYCLTAQELVWLDEVFPSRAAAAVEASISEEDAESFCESDDDGGEPLGKVRKSPFGVKMTKMRNLAKSAGTMQCGVDFNRLVASYLGNAYVMISAIVHYDRVICVFVHWKLFAAIEDTTVSSCLVAKFGNKGAVACKLRMRLGELSTSLTFAGVHFSAGEDAANYMERNNNYESICETLVFNDHRGVEFPEDTDVCFVSGDLNYRLSLKPKESKQTILDTLAAGKGFNLRDKDQLEKARQSGLAFPCPLWREGLATRNVPSYKLDSRKGEENEKLETCCSRVTNNTVMHYDAQRVPAWCDRILWRDVNGNIEVEQEQLQMCATHGKSDHAPVGAHFVLTQRAVPYVHWTLMSPDEIVITMNSIDENPSAKYLRLLFIGDFIEDEYTSSVKGQKSSAKTVYKWDSMVAFVPQFPTAPPFSRGSLHATPLRVVLCDGLKQTCGHAVLPFSNAVKTTNDLAMDFAPSNSYSSLNASDCYSFTEPLVYRGLIVGEISVSIHVE